MTNKDLNKHFDNIAQQFLRIETLEERKMDDLDFHELGVADIWQALNAAYMLGMGEGAKYQRNAMKQQG